MCSCVSACLWRSEDNLGCPPSRPVLFEMDSFVCCSRGYIPWTPKRLGNSLLFPFHLVRRVAGPLRLLSAFTPACWCSAALNCVRPIDKVNYFLFAWGEGGTTSGMIMCVSLSPMTHASRNTNLEGASKFKGMMLINCLEPNCTNCPKVICLCLCHCRTMAGKVLVQSLASSIRQVQFSWPVRRHLAFDKVKELVHSQSRGSELMSPCKLGMWLEEEVAHTFSFLNFRYRWL